MQCCICVPMSIAITTVGVMTFLELFFCAIFSELILSNGGSPTAIFWVLLKLMAVVSFIYLAINRNDVDARRINFVVYTFVQLVELIMISIWLTIVWNSNNYGCMFNAKCPLPLHSCDQCFILMFILGCLILGIPLKVLFMFTCNSYYQEAVQDKDLIKVDSEGRALCPRNNGYESLQNRTNVTGYSGNDSTHHY